MTGYCNCCCFEEMQELNFNFIIKYILRLWLPYSELVRFNVRSIHNKTEGWKNQTFSRRTCIFAKFQCIFALITQLL